jgi:hypothetical protein
MNDKAAHVTGILVVVCLAIAFSGRGQDVAAANAPSARIPADVKQVEREWKETRIKSLALAGKLQEEGRRVDLDQFYRVRCVACSFGVGHVRHVPDGTEYIAHLKETARRLALLACRNEVETKMRVGSPELGIIIHSERLHTEILLARAEGRLALPPPVLCGGVTIDAR